MAIITTAMRFAYWKAVLRLLNIYSFVLLSYFTAAYVTATQAVLRACGTRIDIIVGKIMYRRYGGLVCIGRSTYLPKKKKCWKNRKKKNKPVCRFRLEPICHIGTRENPPEFIVIFDPISVNNFYFFFFPILVSTRRGMYFTSTLGEVGSCYRIVSLFIYSVFSHLNFDENFCVSIISVKLSSSAISIRASPDRRPTTVTPHPREERFIAVKLSITMSR